MSPGKALVSPAEQMLPDAAEHRLDRTTTTGGPFFEDLAVGMVDRTAPPQTITEGLIAVHQSIVGDRFRLSLDDHLAEAVIGPGCRLAPPPVVWNVAIGQSTTVTQRVIANLFYRGLVFHRAPIVGDTLQTSTEIVALRQNRPREGRRATGLAALRIRTVDQENRSVLDFWRCAMLPMRDPTAQTDRQDSFDSIPEKLDRSTLQPAFVGWQLDRLTSAQAPPEIVPGERAAVDGGDVVSSAPELARLTLNIAAVHHDQYANPAGRRLVFGGHTIAIAAAQATRIYPNLIAILAWHRCDHLAPVYEGDTLRSEIEVEAVERLSTRARLVDLRSLVRAQRTDADDTRVLDWRFIALMT